MINIVKIGSSVDFYDGNNKVTMDNQETIAALLRAFDNAGVEYNIIMDDDVKKTENGTIKNLFGFTTTERLW